MSCPNCGMPIPHDGPCPASLEWTDKVRVLQNRYEIVSRLGQGGMGTVYLARDKRLADRPCVVKKLRDDFFREEDRQKAVLMFEREAQVLSRLDHANIVQVLDYFEEDNSYFLVMDYIEGRDLSSILRERGEPFPEEQVIAWSIQICNVLDYLHSHEPPVIYRDLKPSNIMLDVKGRIKLVDFGIARPFDPNSEGTQVVSAGYSPPEQYWGEADTRSDIYSLGATMYFLLTGKHPEALRMLSPQKINPHVSVWLDRLIQKASSQDLTMRYQSALSLRDALNFLPNREKAAARRNKTSEILIGVGLAVLSALALFAYIHFDEYLRKQQSEMSSNQELTTRLQSYSRMADAEQKAISDWKKQGAGNRSPDSYIAQEDSELSLTDPAAAGLSSQDKGDNVQGFSF